MQKEDLSIIVVDDLQFSREVVKSTLTKSGFSNIRTAASANEALYLINLRRADVVLADFWMPDMNGLELADLIRRWDENNDRYTGIVLLTAEDTSSSIAVAFDRGVDDFISKSANQFELSARVYGAGQHAAKQNELRDKIRSLSNQYMRMRQHSMQDPETGLANRNQLDHHLNSLISHCNTRDGGIAVALIEVNSEDAELRRGTLKTIANSIQMSLRPMDLVSRFNSNTFAVVIHYLDPQVFNPKMFERLIGSILKHTRQTSDQGAHLQISNGVWFSHELDPQPELASIFDQAREASEIIR